MRMHILGTGSIGSLMAFYLRRTLPKQTPLMLLHRNHELAFAAQQMGRNWVALEHKGVLLTSYGLINDVYSEKITRKLRRRGQIIAGEDPEQSTRMIQSLIVTTKAYSVTEAVQNLLPRLSAASTIVLMQNGVGLYEELCEEVFPDPLNRPHFVVAVNNHGVWLKKPLHAVHSGVGNIKLAIMPDGLGRDFERTYREDPNPETAKLNLDDIHTNVREDSEGPRYYSLRYTIQTLVGTQDLNVSWIPAYDFHLAQLRKLVVNCVINPLTALYGCHNGTILEQYSGETIARKICTEASAAFFAQWAAQRRAAGLDERKWEFPVTLTAESLYAETKRVALGTKSNISSMLADIRQRSRTEINYMNGYLVNLGRKYDVDMPTNELMVLLIRLRRNVPLHSVL